MCFQMQLVLAEPYSAPYDTMIPHLLSDRLKPLKKN
jgi:hypothetical protein